jgi:two-component system, NarL family, sensor kinase
MEKWQHSETIAVWLIVSCAVFFLLAFWIVRLFRIGFVRIVQTELKEAKLQLYHQEQLLEVQERERIRFAADLHDGLIGKLLVAQLKNQSPGKEEEIDGLLKEVIDEARRISHDLSPPMIGHSTLSELIGGLTFAWTQTIRIDFEQDVRAAESLPDRIKIQLIRILQELITNAVRHAEAGGIVIRYRYTPDWLVLQLCDDGKGFDPSAVSGGIGMHNIDLRMQHMNGRYRITTAGNKGTSVLLVLGTQQFNDYERH